MKTTQAWVFRGRWEMFGKRGAIGRTPGITEGKMASLEGKPNPDVQTALHHDWRTKGPQADAGLPAGPQSEYVVEALLQLKWDIKMLQFCFQKMIWSFIVTQKDWFASVMMWFPAQGFSAYFKCVSPLCRNKPSSWGAPTSGPQGLPRLPLSLENVKIKSSLLVKICMSRNIRRFPGSRFYLTACAFVFCCFAFFVMLLL